MTIWSDLLQFIYPRLCVGCTRVIPPTLVLCQTCLGAVTPVPSLKLAINDDVVLTVHACSLYDQPIKRLITGKFSHDQRPTLALAQLMHTLMPSEQLRADFFIPIPLHWCRYAQRGFNQARVLANELGRLQSTPVYPLLRRTRATGYQSQLNKADRDKNLIGAFASAWRYSRSIESLVKGRSIILIDDLCTTGNTLINAAQVLALYQPRSISAVVASRVA